MPSAEDKFKASLTSIIRRTLGAKIIERIDYLALYACKVVSQNADGTLELIADDQRVGAPSSVPIRYGVPGILATVPVGSRCYLTFAAADPSKPIVVDWESGTSLSITLKSSLIKLGSANSSHPLIFGDDFTDNAGAFWTLINAIATAVGGIPTGGATAGAAITTALNAYLTSAVAKLSTVSKTS